MTTQHTPPVWTSLFNAVILWRSGAEPTEGGMASAQWRRTRANLRRGNTLATEHYAYPYVLPYLQEGAPTLTKSVALHLAAIAAEYDQIPVFESAEDCKHRSLGQWCNLVSRGLAERHGNPVVLDPTTPDSIASRLMYLPSQDVIAAITSIRRIMALASQLDRVPALDFKDLFETFFYWGNGLSNNSVRRRRRVLEDYYSGFNASHPQS